MSELPENLAEYCAKHRTRQRGLENGTVKVTGKKVKKWLGYYHVYIDGKRIKRSRVIAECTAMTKTQARDEHRAWIRRQHEQPVADTAQATVATLCDDYMAMREGDWEKHTRSSHRSLFDRVIKPALGAKAIDAVTAEDLKRFVNHLPDRTHTTPTGKVKHGISLSYVRKIIIMLRGIFDLAAERDLINKNPARSIMVRLRTPKASRPPDKRWFPPQHLPAFLAQLDRRDSLLVWISILGATRPNELFAITGRDVGSTWIHIQRALDSWRQVKTTKTGKQRYIFLPPQIAQELQAWIQAEGIEPDDLVFRNARGEAINRQNFLLRRLRPAAVRAKIPITDVDFRMLRRSFATVAQVVGLTVKSIQSQLGHARPDMTATEYMQPIDALTAGQLQRLEDMLRGRIEMPMDMTEKLGSRRVQ